MPRDKAIKVGSGDVVALAFVLRDADGKTLTEAEQSDPLVLLHDGRFAIPPIHTALEGKEAGDRFELTLEEGAFGAAVADAERVIPRDRLPSGPLPSGTSVSLMDGDEARTAWVLREAGAHVVVSLSHPWATAATLEAEVLSVRPATSSEREAGFATEVTATETAAGDEPSEESLSESDADESGADESDTAKVGDNDSDDSDDSDDSGDDNSDDEDSDDEDSDDDDSDDDDSNDDDDDSNDDDSNDDDDDHEEE